MSNPNVDVELSDTIKLSFAVCLIGLPRLLSINVQNTSRCLNTLDLYVTLKALNVHQLMFPRNQEFLAH